MKTFKVAHKIVAAWLILALTFDATMIYCHFFNPVAGSKIISHIDKIVY